MEEHPKLFGPLPQARLLHILSRSQLAEESMSEALESITASAALIKVDLETLLGSEFDTMQFNWQTPMHMVAYVMHLMGTYKRLKHRLEIAQRWYTKAMLLKLRAFGRQHPSTQSTAIFLAESMLQRGAEGIGEDGIKEADDILTAAHSVLAQELGPQHELTLYCRQDLAEALWQMKQYDEACKMTEEVYEITKKGYGEKSSHTLLALRRYAKMLQNCGQQDKSYKICLDRENACREVFGNTSYTTIEAICDTALTALFLKKSDEAVSKATEALKFAEAQYGSAHQFCAYPIDVLARCRYMADNLDEALELFKRRLSMCDKTDPDYYTFVHNAGKI
jgi:tetratricopeptide (TPR) repeat protein